MTRRRFWLRVTGALLAFCTGLGAFAVLTGVVLNPVLRPVRDTGVPTAKIAELRGIAGDIDVLVLGTSRLLHGFDPQQFYRETAQLGRPLHAYNLSLERLLLWEQVRVLDQALDLPGFHPRMVVLESCVGLGIAPENFTHARTIGFETPASYREAVACILGSDRTPLHQAWNIATHSLVLGLNQTHYGLYARDAFPAIMGPKDEDLSGRLGFDPKPDLPVGAAPDSWLVQLARDLPAVRAKEFATPTRFPATMAAHFAHLQARLRTRGITCIFIQPPQLAFTDAELQDLTVGFARALASVAPDPVVISFLDPTLHPELYDPTLWVDYNHLTAAGAKRLTHDIARDLVPLVPR